MRETTPHRYKAGAKQVIPADMVVIHWTASPRGDGKDGTNEPRIRRWARGETRVSSTHFVVLRDGRLLQTCPLTDRPWHAKGSAWETPEGRTVLNINNRAIAIDMECVGPLKKGPAGKLSDSYGGGFGGPAELCNGQWWEAYTDAQVKTLVGLAALLVSVFPILKDPARWVGHCDIRKTKPDPGPHFPWATLRSTLEALP